MQQVLQSRFEQAKDLDAGVLREAPEGAEGEGGGRFVEKVTVILDECRGLGKGFEVVEA